MKNILRLNAEFARNLWLEFSLQRLIAAPALIILLTALIAMNGGAESNVIIHWGSLAVFGIFGGIWGLKNAADSIIDEYNDKTWDWQRMSIIGPWKLAWGKLFGSTIYNWYIAGIALLIYIVTSLQMDEPVTQIKIGIIGVLSMIIIHGLMIMFSLITLRRGDGRTKIRSNRIFIIGIFLVMMIYRQISTGLFFGSAVFKLHWYGLLSSPADIAILSGLFYGFWVIAGIYRSMRAELQYTDKPLWWIAFIVTNFFFQYGYVATSDFSLSGGLALTFGVAFIQSLVMVYFLALAEPKDIINFRLLQNSFNKRDFDTFFRNIPLWLTTLPIAFIFGILTVIFLQTTAEDSFLQNFLAEIQHSGKSVFVLIAVFGFVLRDLGILLLLNFSTRPRRANGAMVIYLVMLYLLVPMLTYKFGFGAIFYPDPKVNVLLMIFFPLAEAGVVLYFLWDRWKSLSRG